MSTISTQFIAYLAATLMILSVAFVSMSSYAAAATYAYVDAQGNVKSVTANDWMSAIAVAPNIHMHSGVMLLTSASDYTVVGSSVNVK
jgi:hypothetical protein